MKIKYIAQRQKSDCVIACLAMITGISYNRIIPNFWRDFNKTGLEIEHAANYLMDCGFFIIIKEGRGSLNNTVLNKEMWKPFAEIHLIHVQQYLDRPQISHAIVMDNKGKIYDPGDIEATKQTYYEVKKVVGCFKQ